MNRLALSTQTRDASAGAWSDEVEAIPDQDQGKVPYAHFIVKLSWLVTNVFGYAATVNLSTGGI